MSDESVWKQRFDRERQARKSAEKLLEDKSLEIWTINQSLEAVVKQRTQELEAALQKAQDASKAKDTFLSNMSHELRTPLNAVIGFSQILIAKPDTPDTVKNYIEKIQISGRNLLELVNTILDFSKIEAGKMDFNPENVILDDVCNEVVMLVEPLIRKKNITLLMPHTDHKKIHVDQQLFKQMLINLLSNAVKFSPEKGTIALKHNKREKGNLFSVCDEGDGIEGSKIEALFEPFMQLASNQNESMKGTGLGLAIVKRIVEMHSGNIWVESIVGKGSCFYIEIPFASIEEEMI